MKLHVLIIDPQNDFVDRGGSLSVPGAAADMDRLAAMIERLAPKIGDIHVTLDSHRRVDISHPMWWVDTAGRHPSPFTLITAADVADGRWTTYRPGMRARSLQYLRDLETRGRYPHVIWPEHCLIGDPGHNVWPTLAGAIHQWEDRFAVADFVTKGSNPWTEHFSGVMAEVPDPADPTTQLNTGLIRTLEEADIIAFAGEASSHCVANTGRDILDNFSAPQFAQKVVLLTDAMSPVPTFEKLADDFFRDMRAAGMRTSTTVDFLA